MFSKLGGFGNVSHVVGVRNAATFHRAAGDGDFLGDSG